jgi:hypothetical protein
MWISQLVLIQGDGGSESRTWAAFCQLDFLLTEPPDPLENSYIIWNEILLKIWLEYTVSLIRHQLKSRDSCVRRHKYWYFALLQNSDQLTMYSEVTCKVLIWSLCYFRTNSCIISAGLKVYEDRRALIAFCSSFSVWNRWSCQIFSHFSGVNLCALFCAREGVELTLGLIADIWTQETF